MKIQRLPVIGLISFLALWGSKPAFGASLMSVEAYGTDTVAGYETSLKTVKISSWQDVTFHVVKPDGTVLNLNANSGGDGIARLSLSDYHTRSAGHYEVMATYGLNSPQQQGVFHGFEVYPDKVSVDQSTVTLDKTLVQLSGGDFATLTVKLMDDYGNPVNNHMVQVFSNRTQDQTTGVSSDGVTDSRGEIKFRLVSKQKGVSEYSVLDATSGVMLSRTVGVAYLNGSELMSDVGGEFPFFIDTAKAAAGSLHHFDISGLPATIQANQNINFTVTAQDDANQTVQNYLGKVHFSAEGANSSNVTLPEDYTFKAEDLGTHQFSLGLSFSSNGNYKIVVTDLANTLIKGTKDVTVGSGGGSTQQGGSLNISLDTPIAGTYSQNVQTISGNAQSGYTVKIYDNQQEIGSVQATSAGKYSFQTSPLADGAHSVYAVMYDSMQAAKGTSSTVQFTIDTTPPAVDDLTLDPNTGIQPGTPINVLIVSEENLSQVAVVFNGDIIQFNPSLENPGTYVGTIQAPATPGVYPLDVLLVDQLSNEGSYKEKAKITVSNEGGSVVTQESTQEVLPATQEQTQEVLPPAQPENTAPSKVTGVLTYAGSKKVTLVWDAAADNETLVKRYRIYYGLDSTNLDMHADTKDAGTTWYIPNLENGREYYFAVTAFDSEGLESAVLSEIVSGIPFSSEVAGLGQVSGQLGSGFHAAAGEFVAPPSTPKNGPELLWFLFGSGAAGTLVQRMKRKRNK